jgi:hypothetical protein
MKKILLALLATVSLASASPYSDDAAHTADEYSEMKERPGMIVAASEDIALIQYDQAYPPLNITWVSGYHFKAHTHIFFLVQPLFGGFQFTITDHQGQIGIYQASPL